MKNRYWGTDILMVLLLVTSRFFAGVAMYSRPDKAIIYLGIFLLLILVIILNINSVRRIIRGIFFGHGKQGARQQLSFEHLDIPVAIINKGSIVWYNEAFRTMVLFGEDCYLTPISKIVRDFKPEDAVGRRGKSIVIDNKEFTVFAACASDDDTLWVCYFVEDTNLKFEAREFHLSKPVIMDIVVDTYDEILMNMRESQRAWIMASLDRLIEDSANSVNGIFLKLGNSRYKVFIEDRHYSKFYDNHFEILAKARALDNANSVTLSVGVGRGGKDFSECDSLARQALDMALGRGGDQVVIKNEEGYEFFSGTRQGVEKRSKVRSRIVANALRDVIMQSDTVLIMGHRNSDFDAIGARVGMAEAVRSCGKKAHIYVKEDATQAKNLIDKIKDTPEASDLFITYDRAMHYAASSDTLLVVVDTHAAAMTESSELCSKCARKVVIDHHRRTADYIKDTVVSYHETYASSASELVTELLQYMLPANYRISRRRAVGLLSGIMLDTRNFSESAGVRTFEAAAYLRRRGASSSEVLKLFSVPKEVYMAKSALVGSATIYKNVAIALSDGISGELSVAVPQAANDLLTLDDVKASVVAVKFDDKVNISARSMGDMNVQILMEYLGGGGHLTMAGAQLADVTIDEAGDKIRESIDNYQV